VRTQMTTSSFTPPEIARRLRVSPEKVLGWIRSGELRAINVAARPTGRPRFRIEPADLSAFEERRSGHAPRATLKKKRKKDSSVIEFF